MVLLTYTEKMLKNKRKSRGKKAISSSQKVKSLKVHKKKASTEKKKTSIETKLWDAADSLRKNIDAAEYKHIVLGLVFLKYISDSFEALYNKLKQNKGADPEDRDEYKAENVFLVPPAARWSYLQSRARSPEIGKNIDAAMDNIEKDNPSLKGVLPKIYARGNLDSKTLGKLIDEFSNIDMEGAKARSADILGHVFEYFLGQFGLAEGKKGGQFYTPRSVVKLLVEMLEPYKGKVFDPCCGTGGMFVQSNKFVKEHQGRVSDIFIHGQESNQTTWRLAKMNLAIRSIGSSQVKWNNEGSFLRNAHRDLKAAYVIANPPFNDSNWSGNLLKKDGRWKYGVPPVGNANYAWIQHFIYHLKPKNGQAGFVMAKGALTSTSSGEGEIRKNIIEAQLVDCIVNLPAKLFLNTQIPASLWFLRRGKTYRKEEILFIDARNLGELVTRRNKVLTDEDIKKIADVYHNWCSPKKKNYKDVKGFCKSATVKEVKKLNYVLSPGRYVGLPEEEDDFDFHERFTTLKAELEEQLKEESKLNKRILKNLSRIEYEK